MADSPESYQSSSQGSWEANDLLRQRPQSVSSVPAGSSPLSVNMTQDQLMTFGIYPGDEGQYFKHTIYFLLYYYLFFHYLL